MISETKTELIYTNRMVQSSMKSILKIDEALLKTTGERLLENGLFAGGDKTRSILDMLLHDNPAFAGVGLAQLDGKIVITSSNMSSANVPNLKTTAETANSFNKALRSDTLVIGRTYYVKELKEWLAPIRFRIKDENNNSVAVLAGGVRITAQHSPWSSGENQDNLELSIVRSDGFFQYYSANTSFSPEHIYAQPINKDYLRNFELRMKEETGYTREQLKSHPNLIVSLIYSRPPNGHSIAAISYDSTYDLYILTKKNIVDIYSKMIPPVSWMAIILILFNALLFSLFKYHERLQITSEKNLSYLAEHDQLTGLPNMRFLTLIFDKWVKDHNHDVSVIFIDLDNFKEINDLHSHAIGDEVIKSVARIINDSFPECLCIRQGGDEFIVITNQSGNSIGLCKSFLFRLKQKLHIDEYEFSIRASIGISNYPIHGTQISQLLRNSDIAMYEAKKNKTGISTYSKNSILNKEKYALISKELNHALERKEMYMVYQPQFDIQSGKIIGVESLIRWNNEKMGKVMPDDFISIAESTGSIYDIGDFVIQQVLSDFNSTFHDFVIAYSKDNRQKFKVSINVSTNQLVSQGHIINLVAKIKEEISDDIRLVLEITESDNLDKANNIADNLKVLKSSGVDISLDDFGTGYSSLSHIIKLPIDEIKIDKSFVQAVEHDHQSEVLVKSIISLSNNLNVDVLSEGVETEQQLKHMRKFDCRYFQGYYFSLPLKKTDLLSLLNNSENIQY